MILVINLNPSLDKIYTIQSLKYGQVMRTENVQNTAGGKGTHVANVINILQESCTITGFLGGHIGKFIADNLVEKGITDQSTNIQAETRSCINIATADGKQTEILEPGPWITSPEQADFLTTYKKLLKSADIITASGSLPKNIEPDFYNKLITLANAAGKKFLLDTSGKALQEGIKAKPFFIKPNKDEVEALTGNKINSIEDAVREIRTFVQKDIKLPVISLGKQGSIAAFAGKIYHAMPPTLEAVNAVGSGDAYVAGIASGLHRQLDIQSILRLASACGTANILEKESGFVRQQQVQMLLPNIVIKQLS